MTHLRLALACFMLCLVVLGAFGMRDTDRRKMPLAAWGAILLVAGLTRGEREANALHSLGDRYDEEA